VKLEEVDTELGIEYSSVSNKRDRRLQRPTRLMSSGVNNAPVHAGRETRGGRGGGASWPI